VTLRGFPRLGQLDPLSLYRGRQAHRRRRAYSIPGNADDIASRSCGLKTAASR
jgi:hypothetical protein